MPPLFQVQVEEVSVCEPVSPAEEASSETAQ